ncbi:MAG: GDSL-type esterase/lipase family protein [Planctomycetota bacterium]
MRYKQPNLGSRWGLIAWLVTMAASATCLSVSAAETEDADHPRAKYSGVIPVELRKDGDGWQLLRGGEPFTLKGGGVTPGHYADFAAIGGNSVRTWGLSNAEAVLDEAYEAGIGVMMGIWMTHPKHGYDYGDEQRNAQQISDAVAAVERLKDHPALLFWGVGNEVEIQTPSDERIYQQINRLAKAIKEVDPHHPTVVVTAGTGSDRVRMVAEHCPDVDIYGPNVYGRNMLGAIDRIYEKSPNLDKPLIFPEWGPSGQWGRTDRTDWGSVIEPSSTQKASMYLTNWVTTLNAGDPRLLGGYIFYYRYENKPDDGTKWPSWYSMHHHTGEPFGGADVAEWAFSGDWPENLAPEIEALRSSAARQRVAPGSEHRAEVIAYDRNGDELDFEWVLSPDHEARQQIIKPKFQKIDPANWLVSSDGPTLLFRVPDDALGPYRLHVVVRDRQGKAARANVPLFVGSDEAHRAAQIAQVDPNKRDAQAQTLLILGDSNAASETGWVAQLKKKRPRYTFLNTSIPGATIGFDNNGSERLNTLKMLEERLEVMDQRAADSYSRKVDTIVINLGTNDSKAVFDGRGDEVVANLRTLIERLRGHYEFVQAGLDLRIVVMSPPPYGPDEILAEKYLGGAERVAALVPRFRALAQEMGVMFVDIHTPLENRMDEVSPDGVHFNEAGQKIIAERLFGKLVADRPG